MALLRSALLLSAAAAAAGYSSPVHGPASSSTPAAAVYFNPVLQRDFPDPTVTRAPDGSFWAYATTGSGHIFQVANSSDLVSWNYLGEAMPSRPAWADPTPGYSWAPDVAYHNNSEAALGPGFYMYYAMRHTGQYMCIGVAFSADPAGPFQDARGAAGPLWCDDSTDFHAIDPKAFVDPLSGNIYLYYGSDFIPLRALQLSRNLTSVADGPAGTPTDVILTSTAPYEGLVEGSWVWYRAASSGEGQEEEEKEGSTTTTTTTATSSAPGYYYFLYSGDNCCGTTAHYALMVARATSPLGPFTKLGPAAGLPGNSSTILTSPLGSGWPFQAPGHNSIVMDDAGQEWVMYHAYNYSGPAGGQGAGRQLMMDRLTYVPIPGTDGLWPVLASANGVNGQPGVGPLPAPVVKGRVSGTY